MENPGDIFLDFLVLSPKNIRQEPVAAPVTWGWRPALSGVLVDKPDSGRDAQMPWPLSHN